MSVTVDDVAPELARESAIRVVRRGLALTPEFKRGIGLTLTFAVLATVGRIVVPLAVQQTIDHGLTADSPNLTALRWGVVGCAVVVLLAAWSSYAMNVRLYRASEGSLATLRVRAFRHVHDLSMLHQQSERRGSLVSRVTSDVDEVSQFLQWGGILLVVSALQIVLATTLMLVYSWQLTLLTYICFLPMVFLMSAFQKRLDKLYGVVRQRVGEMLGAVAESVVGAPVIRAYGIEQRTAKHIDKAIDRHRTVATKANAVGALMFSTSEVIAGIGLAVIVSAGVLLGVDGRISAGRLIAFLFLVTLFVSPLQVVAEVVGEAQTAIAGWRRVLDILDTRPDVEDPAVARELPDGPLSVRFEHVRFAYPDGPDVLHDVDLEIAAETRVAIVGETGSGKTTFAKLLTRLMDPTSGRVYLSGVPLDEVAFSSLRRRVVMVPQDGFLFDSTIAENVMYGADGLTRADVENAFTELGLNDWLGALPLGVDTPVGERGEGLSVGERQLIAVARAYVADPHLLVLDEATSAVDPATDVRLQRALDGLTRGRTSVAIAHRLSTAEAADEILVVDKGRIVQRGPHRVLVAQPGRYADLYASWIRQTAT
jgi:putative ABC transport system ATP-binding protein